MIEERSKLNSKERSAAVAVRKTSGMQRKLSIIAGHQEAVTLGLSLPVLDLSGLKHWLVLLMA